MALFVFALDFMASLDGYFARMEFGCRGIRQGCLFAGLEVTGQGRIEAAYWKNAENILPGGANGGAPAPLR
jgi:hypothetical protein